MLKIIGLNHNEEDGFLYIIKCLKKTGNFVHMLSSVHAVGTHSLFEKAKQEDITSFNTKRRI